MLSWDFVYGLGLAGTISLAAWRVGVLSPGGAIAALVLGAASVVAGWEYAWLLIVFFVSSSGVSRLSAAHKAERSAEIVAKGGRRDATQVLANGGIFVLAAIAARVTHSDAWSAAAIGSLAAATADTWSTELGMLSASDPWLFRERKRVPAGTSGAVSVVGLLATLGGAVFMAVVSLSLGWDARLAVAAGAGGVAGALMDTVFGAFVQARRRCPRCGTMTERRTHTCGTHTDLVRGPAWLNNDAVNMVCAATGAIAAVLWIS